MEQELIPWVMVAIVGTVGVLKNFIDFGGRKFWTAITLIVGIGVAIAAMYIPMKALQVWVAVTGATLFYDTIFKVFQRIIEAIAKKYGPKIEEESIEDKR